MPESADILPTSGADLGSSVGDTVVCVDPGRAEPEPTIADVPAEEQRDDRRREGRWDYWDLLLVGAIAVLTVAVHPVGTMRTRPYWLDEAWVATLTKAPLLHVPRLNVSTPVGFVAALKFFHALGLQSLRLVVLGFTVLCAVMAYTLTRDLRWNSRAMARGGAAVAALVVVFAPFSLQRNDLKQYASDAFFALVILYVAAAVGRSSNPKGPWVLGVAALVSLPFSSTTAFVSIAAFAGLLVSQFLVGSRQRARTTLIAGAATGVLLAAYFAGVILPRDNDKLQQYWKARYLTGSPWHTLHAAWVRFLQFRSALGISPILLLVLCAVGIVVLARMGEVTLAVAFPVLWCEMVALARLGKYPFLDVRTSHFLLVSSAVLAAIGAVGLLRMVAHANVPLCVALSFALCALFANGARPNIYRFKDFREDTKSQTQYAASHHQPGDVILVNHSATEGFSYYWPHGHIKFSQADLTKGFRSEVEGAIYVADGSHDAVLASLRTAVGRWQASPSGSHLFIVRSHVQGPERAAWPRAFEELNVHPTAVTAGPEVLLALTRP